MQSWFAEFIEFTDENKIKNLDEARLKPLLEVAALKSASFPTQNHFKLRGLWSTPIPKEYPRSNFNTNVLCGTFSFWDTKNVDPGNAFFYAIVKLEKGETTNEKELEKHESFTTNEHALTALNSRMRAIHNMYTQ